MTLADAMALSAGVAIALATSPVSVEVLAISGPSGLNHLIEAAGWFVCQCLCPVFLARQARHRRPPWPSEWLAFAAAANFQVSWRSHWNLEEILSRLPPDLFALGVDYDMLRWGSATLGVVAIAAGVAALGAWGKGLPRWSRTVGLFVLMMLADWDTLWVLSTDGVDLLAPRGGYSGTTISYLHFVVNCAVMSIPEGLCLGIPLMATLADLRRGGRRPNWAERAALIASAVPWAWLTVMDGGIFGVPSTGWVGERVIRAGKLVCVLMLGWAIERRLGPWWRSWFDAGWAEIASDQDRLSSSADDSRGSTR